MVTEYFVFLILWGRGECVSAVVEVLLGLPFTGCCWVSPLGGVWHRQQREAAHLVAAVWSSIQRSADRQNNSRPPINFSFRKEGWAECPVTQLSEQLSLVWECWQDPVHPGCLAVTKRKRTAEHRLTLASQAVSCKKGATHIRKEVELCPFEDGTILCVKTPASPLKKICSVMFSQIGGWKKPQHLKASVFVHTDNRQEIRKTRRLQYTRTNKTLELKRWNDFALKITK